MPGLLALTDNLPPVQGVGEGAAVENPSPLLFGSNFSWPVIGD